MAETGTFSSSLSFTYTSTSRRTFTLTRSQTITSTAVCEEAGGFVSVPATSSVEITFTSALGALCLESDSVFKVATKGTTGDATYADKVAMSGSAKFHVLGEVTDVLAATLYNPGGTAIEVRPYAIR